MKKTLLLLCLFSMLFTLAAAKDKKARRKERKEEFLRRQTRQANVPKGWLTYLEEAKKAAQKNNLPILVIITSTQSYNTSRTLDRKVIQNPDFQSEIKLYAVVVYLDYPKNCSDEKVIDDVKKCTFFHDRVPCIGVVDAEMNLLAQPKSLTRQGIVAAARQAARKMAKDAAKRERDDAEKTDEENDGAEEKEAPADKPENAAKPAGDAGKEKAAPASKTEKK